VEENSLLGGFGSAILEFAEKIGLNHLAIKRIGIPDEFIEHGPRKILLKELGLDKEGIYKTVRNMLETEKKISSKQMDF